ncbi:MAG: MBL fold metallo-hydrolase [Bacteroidia bacterium]|nr:MBL fold metallo-hydrolase [Bacteroidia bacterium]
MKLHFLGAARQVTGSMYLLETADKYRILVDCGMDYELKRNAVDQGPIFPFNPADIDLVLLTHAHIDHSGNLPVLVKDGFKGQIVCTPATAELTAYLLYDSSHIQFSDYRKNLANARKTRRHLIPKPLYSEKNVSETIDRFYTIHLNKAFQPRPDIEITFQEAGHLLGAAGIKISILENGKKQVFGFSGDIGRLNSKLVKDGTPFSGIDYLISESTYGGRKHTITKTAEDELFDYIHDTCIKQRGRLVIPAFSVGRTQAIVFTINQLKRAGKIPEHLKIFVDSPLAIKSTPVYERHPELLNEEALSFKANHGDLFNYPGIEYLENKDEHEALTYYFDPCVIISAAGMVEGGRIQEHVMNNIENPYSTILIAGFCAEGTLGYRLLLGQPTIQIKKKDKRVYARIARTDVFSSHPDHDEVLHFIKESGGKNLKQVFLVHGELPQLQAMEMALHEEGISHVTLPEHGQVIDF